MTESDLAQVAKPHLVVTPPPRSRDKRSYLVFRQPTGSLLFIAGAMIDADGTGPSHGDPCKQNETSFRVQGASLNADRDNYIALPPEVIRSVAPRVLGCAVEITDMRCRRKVLAIVGDVGPRGKLGEISIAAARDLLINPDPVHGGISERVFLYRIYPGVPGVIAGDVVQLQRFGMPQ